MGQSLPRVKAELALSWNESCVGRRERLFRHQEDVSDGNPSAHARKLEEAGYVVCTKSFEARRPRSEYRITSVGKKALLRYLEHIEAVIKATRRT